MSLTIPTQASALRINGYILIDNHPCKITNMSTSKPGKHGSAKINFIGIDIFTEKKYEHSITTTHNVESPIVNKNEYQLLDIDEDIVSYLDTKGEMQSDLVMPKLCNSDLELTASLKETYDSLTNETIYIGVISAMEISAIKSFKVVRN